MVKEIKTKLDRYMQTAEKEKALEYFDMFTAVSFFKITYLTEGANKCYKYLQFLESIDDYVSE